MIITILAIFLWYTFSSLREGMLWSKKETFLTIPDHTYSMLFIPISFCLVIAQTFVMFPIISMILTLLFVYTIVIREKLSVANPKYFYYEWFDYHLVRAIEGGLFFIPCWIILKDFFLLSALWIIGNWIYKRVMNRVMYGHFSHKLTMTTYWMFGKPFPYSDRWYDWSLILPAIYFLIKIL